MHYMFPAFIFSAFLNFLCCYSYTCGFHGILIWALCVMLDFISTCRRQWLWWSTCYWDCCFCQPGWFGECKEVGGTIKFIFCSSVRNPCLRKKNTASILALFKWIYSSYCNSFRLSELISYFITCSEAGGEPENAAVTANVSEWHLNESLFNRCLLYAEMFCLWHQKQNVYYSFYLLLYSTCSLWGERHLDLTPENMRLVNKHA